MIINYSNIFTSCKSAIIYFQIYTCIRSYYHRSIYPQIYSLLCWSTDISFNPPCNHEGFPVMIASSVRENVINRKALSLFPSIFLSPSHLLSLFLSVSILVSTRNSRTLHGCKRGHSRSLRGNSSGLSSRCISCGRLEDLALLFI